MAYRLFQTATAQEQLAELERDKGKEKVLEAVRRALAKLENNPRHPGLHTHTRKAEECPHKKTLFQAYAQNNTPGAYRIFFCFCIGDDKQATINVLAITPHP